MIVRMGVIVKLQQAWERMSTPVRFFVVLAIAILYLHTWIGGQTAHLQEMTAQANRNYAAAVRINEERLAAGLSPTYKLRVGGPRGRVNWCFAVLPGVLWTDSSYTVGPQYAEGGEKIVIFYGLGSVTLLKLSSWRA